MIFGRITQLAKLTDEEMSAVNNLEYLGVQAPKKQNSSGVEKFALKFGARKVKHGTWSVVFDGIVQWLEQFLFLTECRVLSCYGSLNDLQEKQKRWMKMVISFLGSIHYYRYTCNEFRS